MGVVHGKTTNESSRPSGAVVADVGSEAEWKALCKALENASVQKTDGGQQSFRLRL